MAALRYCSLKTDRINWSTVSRCGSSSVARMSPSQGEGRGFESRLPLRYDSPDAFEVLHLNRTGMKPAAKLLQGRSA
jgi:hypothetical protein